MIEHCGELATCRRKGPHIGAYCSKCGAWIKWVTQGVAEQLGFTPEVPQEYFSDGVKVDGNTISYPNNEEPPF